MQNKKWSIFLCVFCVVSVLLTACSFGGNATVVTCDGYEFKLGKTTVAELKEAGFTNRYSRIEKETIDSMTWENFYAMKGEVSYGTMLVANKKSSQIEFDKGVIFEISFCYNDPDYPLGEVLVDGVNYEGCTRDEIKEKMGSTKITLDDDRFLVYESDHCEYTFIFEDGSETLTDLWINDGTEKEYSMN